MSEEMRAVLEAERDELLREHDEISHRWYEHELSTTEAILLQMEINNQLLPILKQLAI